MDKQMKAINIKNPNIRMSGLNWLGSNSDYCRLPEDKLHECNDFVIAEAKSTAGVNISFKTNSKIIGLKVIYGEDPDYSHIPRSGASGFDFFIGSGVEKRFLFAFYPVAKQIEFENTYDFGNDEIKEITINFPLYREVKEVELLIEEGALLTAPTPFAVEKPIVFYGSSITQGACASRPGNSYTNILSRWINTNSVNLGFSSGALAEPIMAELIAEIDMSVFVLDYGYNAPTVEYLEETHERFYKLFHEKCPKVPVLFVARPDFDVDPMRNKEIQAVIYKTYKNALDRGETVYYINNSTLFGDKDQDSCTVDGCHPNDLGFMRMAEAVYPVLKKALVNEGYVL